MQDRRFQALQLGDQVQRGSFADQPGPLDGQGCLLGERLKQTAAVSVQWVRGILPHPNQAERPLAAPQRHHDRHAFAAHHAGYRGHRRQVLAEHHDAAAANRQQARDLLGDDRHDRPEFDVGADRLAERVQPFLHVGAALRLLRSVPCLGGD